jgi:hypothetical protein
MTRQRPTVLLVMGSVGLGLGVLYAVWLILSHYGLLGTLLAAGIGDTQAISKLRTLNLASPIAIYATFVSFFLEVVLTAILLWAAGGLITLNPSARWASVFYSIFMILVGTINVILAVFILVPPSGVNVLAVLARGIIVLFAVILWGAMFMPDVKVAYGEEVRLPPMEDIPFEEEEEESAPAPSSRRQPRAR